MVSEKGSPNSIKLIFHSSKNGKKTCLKYIVYKILHSGGTYYGLLKVYVDIR